MKGLPTDSSLPTPSSTASKSKSTLKSHLQLFAILTILALSAFKLSAFFPNAGYAHVLKEELVTLGVKCPAQPEPLFPKIELKFEESYRNYSAHLLSAAVVRFAV